MGAAQGYLFLLRMLLLHPKIQIQGLVQYNIIHRPEEALDIHSELIFIIGMVHLPQEWNLHQQFSLHQIHHRHPSQRLPKQFSRLRDVHVQYTYV